MRGVAFFPDDVVATAEALARHRHQFDTTWPGLSASLSRRNTPPGLWIAPDRRHVAEATAQTSFFSNPVPALRTVPHKDISKRALFPLNNRYVCSANNGFRQQAEGLSA